MLVQVDVNASYRDKDRFVLSLACGHIVIRLATEKCPEELECPACGILDSLNEIDKILAEPEQ